MARQSRATDFRPIAAVRCFCCGLITLLLTASAASAYTQPRLAGLNYQAIEQQLKQEPIVRSKDMAEHLRNVGVGADYHNQVSMITLKSGLRAVFKAGAGRYAEVAAYRACRLINCQFVPPVVTRTINGVKGSLAFYVAPDHRFTGKDLADDQLRRLIGPERLNEVKLFRFVFGQWDIGPGNQIIQKHDGTYSIALIDNEGIILRQHVRYGDYSFVEHGHPSKKKAGSRSIRFPFEKARTERHGTPARLRHLFQPFLTKSAIDALSKVYKRTDRWAKPGQYRPLRYVRWKNRLWIQHFAEHPTITPNAVTAPDPRLIEQYRRLTRADLEQVWKREGNHSRRHIDHLIDLAIERRDQITNVRR